MGSSNNSGTVGAMCSIFVRAIDNISIGIKIPSIIVVYVTIAIIVQAIICYFAIVNSDMCF